MGLRFIYGEAGTGKTTYCFNEIKTKIKDNNKIYIITPEQFSFTAEKRLLDILPNSAVINAEVLTFNRMAHRVFTEVGGAAHTVLTECGNSMLISDILANRKGELKFLGKSEKNIELVARTFTEFKKHGINLETVENLLNETQDMYLKAKINDIYILLKDYQETIQDKYIDSNDVLTKLVENLNESKMFDNAIIYIDEFAGFTEQEYNIIKILLNKAEQVNITICSDWLENTKTQESDIYYQNKITAQKLVELAEERTIRKSNNIKRKI